MCILLAQKVPEEREIMCITSEETETSVQFRREKAEAIGTEEKLCPEDSRHPHPALVWEGLTSKEELVFSLSAENSNTESSASMLCNYPQELDTAFTS